MTAIINQEKVVSKPPDPDQYTPNTLYYVRVGDGFDLYLTDLTGKLLFKLNSGVSKSNVQDYLKGRQKYEQNV